MKNRNVILPLTGHILNQKYPRLGPLPETTPPADTHAMQDGMPPRALVAYDDLETSENDSFPTEPISTTHTPEATVSTAEQSTAIESQEYSPTQPASYYFSPNFTLPLRPLLSTGQRYSTTVGNVLTRDSGAEEQGRRLGNWKENCFFKGLKWAPDGSCVLTSGNDNVLRTFECPASVYDHNEEFPLEPTLSVRAAESIYDFTWYPMMSAYDPATCCFLAASRDHPLHLWDITGSVRCSYSVFDHCDQIVGPNSVAFNPDGTKIYCGYNNMIQIFDTLRPGRASGKWPTTPTRRSREGQKGVISCLNFNFDGSLLAAGSYGCTIGLYDPNLSIPLVALLRGAVGGLTQVQFSPCGNYLFSASRKDSDVLCWDMRNTSEVVGWMQRKLETNQRMAFDIESSGRWLITGDQDGHLLVYSLEELLRTQNPAPSARMKAHEDAIGAVGFHPAGSLLATCSGQRLFEGEEEEEEEEKAAVDNSVRIWRVEGEWKAYAVEERVETG
ncbi:uncharacterized protein VTP21DRAFT_6947 [Calcarisporiella thermophila]|uniref:uncharacterized protein n=1 Tax=Calcarisporiella thermophila TaxID=911321 RepID=UPI003742D521